MTLWTLQTFGVKVFISCMEKYFFYNCGWNIVSFEILIVGKTFQLGVRCLVIISNPQKDNLLVSRE